MTPEQWTQKLTAAAVRVELARKSQTYATCREAAVAHGAQLLLEWAAWLTIRLFGEEAQR